MTAGSRYHRLHAKLTKRLTKETSHSMWLGGVSCYKISIVSCMAKATPLYSENCISLISPLLSICAMAVGQKMLAIIDSFKLFSMHSHHDSPPQMCKKCMLGFNLKRSIKYDWKWCKVDTWTFITEIQESIVKLTSHVLSKCALVCTTQDMGKCKWKLQNWVVAVAYQLVFFLERINFIPT